ncbi:hypothetical protein B0H14DRAFT_2910083, partial [Mycena olivaceomarginata]
MARAPTNETTMFKNWDKFDLIVVYDQSSQTLGGRIRRCRSWCGLISETAFTKLLKCMPMALVGGFDAWRRWASRARRRRRRRYRSPRIRVRRRRLRRRRRPC